MGLPRVVLGLPWLHYTDTDVIEYQETAIKCLKIPMASYIALPWAGDDHGTPPGLTWDHRGFIIRIVSRDSTNKLHTTNIRHDFSRSLEPASLQHPAQ